MGSKTGEGMTHIMQVCVSEKQRLGLDALKAATSVPHAQRIRDAIDLVLYEARADGTIPQLEEST